MESGLNGRAKIDMVAGSCAGSYLRTKELL